METIGHSAVHGGLRGHSINNEIYPFMVVAVGNPSDLRWRVRHPDGHFIIGNGFARAHQAYAKAKDCKRSWEVWRNATV